MFEGFEKCNRNENLLCLFNKDLDYHLHHLENKTISDLTPFNLTLTAFGAECAGLK